MSRRCFKSGNLLAAGDDIVVLVSGTRKFMVLARFMPPTDDISHEFEGSECQQQQQQQQLSVLPTPQPTLSFPVCLGNGRVPIICSVTSTKIDLTSQVISFW